MVYLVWRKEGFRRYLNMYKYLVEGYKEHRTRLFSVVSGEATGKNVNTLNSV